jgi:quinol monooxygenase YgiN
VTAFNVVRFRVKPGNEQRFIDAHREMRPKFKGFLGANLIKTGEQTFCVVGEWRDIESLAAARPEMIAFLDSFRDILEDLGGGLGVTDPVSGESVVAVASKGGKKDKRAKKEKGGEKSKGKSEKKTDKKKKAKGKAKRKK